VRRGEEPGGLLILFWWALTVYLHQNKTQQQVQRSSITYSGAGACGEGSLYTHNPLLMEARVAKITWYLHTQKLIIGCLLGGTICNSSACCLWIKPR
jgi:hypothetical protein